MLNQVSPDFFIMFINYLPTFIGITFNILILVFGILILKKNSYRYGIFLMLSAIISLASNITYIVIGFPDLFYRLYYDLGFDLGTINMIMIAWNFVFLSLSIMSSIFLVIALYLIYKEHRGIRVE